MTTVLVTRPEPGASKMTTKLIALGFDVHKLPLTKIIGLPFMVTAGPFDAVIITSPQALHHVDTSLLSLPLYAVGQACATAATQAGFKSVKPSGGDVVQLVETIRSNLPVNSRLLYLCGKVRRPDLETTLADHAVTVVETYDAQIIDYPAVDLPPMDLVLLTSVQGSAQMVTLMARPELNPSFAQAQFLCLSQRIADGLAGVPSRQIHVSEKPDEDSLLNLAMQIGN